MGAEQGRFFASPDWLAQPQLPTAFALYRMAMQKLIRPAMFATGKRPLIIYTFQFRNYGKSVEKNVITKTKLPAKKCSPEEHRRYKDEIHGYFAHRNSKLDIVTTTTTNKGQTLDWIPRDSQGPIATPPPLPTNMPKHLMVELDEVTEKGPPGTVPILRKNLDDVEINKSLKQYLSRAPGQGHGLNIKDAKKLAAQDLAVTGTHRYGSSAQSVLNWGGEGNLEAWTPWVQSKDDFSLLQIGLLNHDQPLRQSVEAGWQVYQDLYGDWNSHLFVYYTTNGYTKDGDNLGGYNRDVDGWVQVDNSIFPGTISSPTSVLNGQHYQMFIKYQLYNGNWWFMCNGRWIGYYPTSLWQKGGSTFSGLGDHADYIGFWGEVYDSEGRTQTDMGSGVFPDAVGDYAYLSNLKYQSTRANGGNMVDYDGTAQLYADDPSMYRITAHYHDGSSSFGSWQGVGGPGSG